MGRKGDGHGHVVSRDDVAGVWNDISTFNDLEVSVGGSVNWLIDDSLPIARSPKQIDSSTTMRPCLRTISSGLAQRGSVDLVEVLGPR